MYLHTYVHHILTCRGSLYPWCGPFEMYVHIHTNIIIRMNVICIYMHTHTRTRHTVAPQTLSLWPLWNGAVSPEHMQVGTETTNLTPRTNSAPTPHVQPHFWISRHRLKYKQASVSNPRVHTAQNTLIISTVRIHETRARLWRTTIPDVGDETGHENTRQCAKGVWDDLAVFSRTWQGVFAEPPLLCLIIKNCARYAFCTIYFYMLHNSSCVVKVRHLASEGRA